MGRCSGWGCIIWDNSCVSCGERSRGEGAGGGGGEGGGGGGLVVALRISVAGATFSEVVRQLSISETVPVLPA